jgi:hypothetical protein
MNQKYLLAFSVSCLGFLLTGCGVQSNDELAAPIPGSRGVISGAMHAGQQPVVGAAIQLYAAGNTGYGSAAIPLLVSPVITNSTGWFSITGDYTCPANAQVYLVGTGGNPIPGSQANANLGLMAALGPCSSLTSSTFINLNELTTIASVWPLARFMSGYTNVGSSAANSTGLVQAFSAVNELVNIAQGTAPGNLLPANASLSTAEMNTLANILAACVNSTGGTAGDNSSCGNLFVAATPTGGAAPTDTIAAAVNIAKSPGTNVASLFSLSSGMAPFQPALTQAPNNFLIGVNYSGGGLNAPSGLAVDAMGNIWITNNGNSSVTELNGNGSALSPTVGFTGGGLNLPSSIAVGLDGTIWVANKGGNSASQLSSTGSPITGSPHSGGGLNAPSSVAIDASGNVWLANSGNNSLTELNSTGAAISVSNGYLGGGLSQPIAIAVNPY